MTRRVIVSLAVMSIVLGLGIVLLRVSPMSGDRLTLVSVEEVGVRYAPHLALLEEIACGDSPLESLGQNWRDSPLFRRPEIFGVEVYDSVGGYAYHSGHVHNIPYFADRRPKERDRAILVAESYDLDGGKSLTVLRYVKCFENPERGYALILERNAVLKHPRNGDQQPRDREVLIGTEWKW